MQPSRWLITWLKESTHQEKRRIKSYIERYTLPTSTSTRVGFIASAATVERIWTTVFHVHWVTIWLAKSDARKERSEKGNGGSLEEIETTNNERATLPLIRGPPLPLRIIPVSELHRQKLVTVWTQFASSHPFTPQMSTSGSETLADMVRRTSRQSTESGDQPKKSSILVVEIHRSHPLAITQTIYKWICNRVALQEDDLPSSFTKISQGNINRHYLAKDVKENVATGVCIFDQLVFLDPVDLMKNIPEHSVDSVTILQEVDQCIMATSINSFLEATTLCGSSVKLIIVICSEKVSLLAYNSVRRWNPQCKVLLVTGCFPKNLEDGPKTCALTLKENETLSFILDPVKEVKEQQESAK